MPFVTPGIRALSLRMKGRSLHADMESKFHGPASLAAPNVVASTSAP